MTKTKERKVNVSGKPKHTLDVNRNNDVGVDKGSWSAATVRRLKMYYIRPKRGRKEKILKQDLQSKDLPNTRIETDRCWFGALLSLLNFFCFVIRLPKPSLLAASALSFQFLFSISYFSSHQKSRLSIDFY